jgi:hypothetical protein
VALHYYSFAPVNGYIVMDVAGTQVLLDTGSAYTFGSAATWVFLGRTRPLMGSTRNPVSTRAISRHCGSRVDVVLGLDVLAEVPFEIDWHARTVTFAPEREILGETVPLEITMCGPVMPAEMLGRVLRLCVNTSATIGFLPEESLRGTRPAGHTHGFLPTVGAFETQVHAVAVKVAGDTVNLMWGRIPGILGVQLLVSDGLIGTQLFEHFQTRFDLGRKRLTLAPYPAARS